MVCNHQNLGLMAFGPTQESLSQNFKVKVTILARFLLERFLLIRTSQL